MCVYNVGLFQFKECSGFLKQVTICQFVDSLFRSLCSVDLGYLSEDALENDEIGLA